MKKILVCLLALLMVVSMAACGKKEETKTAVDRSELDYNELSAAVYDLNLGEFYELYQTATVEGLPVSERYALMAQAEAKLMEAAVMIPTTTQGGRYAISRVVPYTANYVLYGDDYERYHSILVATEFIKAEDRAAIKALWEDAKGSGTARSQILDYLSSHGYTLKDTYTLAYTSDPQTWDALATSRAADSEAIINTYDGLLEYNDEGILSPALAESYEVSEDGKTYTFHLRSDAKWFDSQGRELGNVTADDFVAGMQHMMDAQGGLEYLVDGVIEGATEYIADPTAVDFSTVGVKAVDDLTLEYTLTKDTPYFLTMLGYNVFAPLNRSFYTSLGGAFGAEYDATASTYGTSPETIAYNGPYLVTNNTAQNTIVFTANPGYYNYDNVTIKTMTWLFNDGTVETKAYDDAKAGTIDSVSLTTSTYSIAQGDGLNDYIYVSTTNATTYMGFINLNRAQFANINDETKVVSTQSTEDAERTYVALNNVHFRRAFAFAYDRVGANAQKVGDSVAANNIRNSYTPWNFVFTSEEVTIDNNGNKLTFPANTSYGEIMQAVIDDDGVKMTVWSADQENGGDGFDGWYNVENAKAELATAIEELKAQGVEVSAENPIIIELPYFATSATYTNASQAFKQSVEAALDGCVVLQLVPANTAQEWYYAGYYTDYGYEANYDVYDLSGWGPDYGDPSTYLDTMLPEGAGYMVKCFGIY